VNHQLLFFGTDRYSNSGSSDVGFWFLKGQVAPGNTPSGGGFKFTGNHTDGDLLVLSTFQVGGTVPQVAVYKWSCPGATSPANCDSTGSLTTVTPSGAADCVNGVGGLAIVGDVCATVNTANGTPSPWPFTEKPSDGSYVAANKFGAGTFFEGGVDMTNLKLANQCFSSFITESRSSQSTTATLSDFDSGTFPLCSASMTTTRSDATVSPGGKVTDTATVTGGGLDTPPFPTSSTDPSVPGAPGSPVNFGICGPSSTAIASCSGLTTSSVGSGNLSNTATQGVSSASVQLDTTGKKPGYYCFTASWAGDANYTAPLSDDGSVGTECFQILQIGTSTVTTPSDSSGTAVTSPVTFDSTLFDKAVVTAGQAGGGNPTGSVSFWICKPSETSLDSHNNPVCTGGTPLAGNPRMPLNAVAGSNPPASSILSSPGVEANIAGTWCFRATYTPDTTVFTGSSDNSNDECFTVSKTSTTTTTAPNDDTNSPPSFVLSPSGLKVSDTATVKGTAAGGNPTGTVSFWLCGPASPAVTTVTGSGSSASCAPDTSTMTSFDTEMLSSVAGSNSDSTATSSDVTITQVGQYCFFAQFTPSGSNGNYNGSSDGGNEECFTVTDSTAASSSQAWVPNDSATITSAGGSPLTGSLTFTLYPNADCNVSEIASGHPDPIKFQQQFTLSGAQGGSTGTTKTTDTSQPTGTAGVISGFSGPITAPPSSQSWSWFSDFEPTDSNIAHSMHCEHTTLSISN
jgi:hypothetical protein